MNILQALDDEIKAVLHRFGHVVHTDVQTVLGKISADIHAGAVVLERLVGVKDLSVGEALAVPASPPVAPAPAPTGAPAKPAA